VYVAGLISDNAFKITPGGTITEIINSAGDGVANGLNSPEGIAVDGTGHVYVTGVTSDNAFKITLASCGPCCRADVLPLLEPCLAGPAVAIQEACDCSDLNGDGHVDLVDVAAFQRVFGQ
jgi:hypothetical protein